MAKRKKKIVKYKMSAGDKKRAFTASLTAKRKRFVNARKVLIPKRAIKREQFAVQYLKYMSDDSYDTFDVYPTQAKAETMARKLYTLCSHLTVRVVKK